MTGGVLLTIIAVAAFDWRYKGSGTTPGLRRSAGEELALDVGREDPYEVFK